MSRWVTFYYDMITDHVACLKAHENKEEALKYFNLHCRSFFYLNHGRFKAKTLPARYGYPHRAYYGISANAFKKKYGVTIDEALKMVYEEGDEK